MCDYKTTTGLGRPGGFDFKLMNSSQLELLCSDTFSNSKANAMDKDHAGFCASLGSNSYYAQCNQYQDHCPVDGLGNNNHCHPNNVIGTGTNYLYLIKEDGKIKCKTPTGEKYSAGTVRCVSTITRRWNEDYTITVN